MGKFSVLLSCAVAVGAFLSSNTLAQWKTPWSYEGLAGPERWSALDPAFSACNAGREQSPIDIQSTAREKLSALRFDYRSGPLKYLINNGKTVRVNYHAPGNENFVFVGAQRYQLTQFHFHRPSEESIHGQTFAMVAHFMHGSREGRVAGVAVLLKSGSANATVQQIWDHMPLVEGSEHEIKGVSLDPAGLLPRDLAYYTYEGSLTAPPCTEGVTWFVLKSPVEISSAQIAAFAKLYPHDVRPAQPLNGRIVRESE